VREQFCGELARSLAVTRQFDDHEGAAVHAAQY
jgi:hypothetical protein